MITYKTNSAVTSKSMTEWFFGKKYVSFMTSKAQDEQKKTGKSESRFFQAGTGFLTIKIG